MKTRGGVDPLLDFRNFLFLVWKHLGLPEPTTIQYDIANYLQYAPKRAIIEAFRGVGKSYITAAYAAWRLYIDPQIKIMVVSAGKERADAFSIFLKRIIEAIPVLHHLKPDPNKNQRDSNVAFDVGPSTPSGSPSVKSVGITGQLTGSRANLIIADDIEIPSNSATNDLREKLANLVKEFSAVLSPEGQIIYLGTPQCEMSLYNTLEGRGYQMRIWCARYPNEEQIKAYAGRLSPIIIDQLEAGALVGTSTDPKRFSDDDLAERELEYGRSGFALQFMLDTSLSDANRYPLKLNDLIVHAVNANTAPSSIRWSNNPLNKLQLPNVGLSGQDYFGPEAVEGPYLPYMKSVLVIDPSGRGKDETAYTVAKWASGNVFVPEVGGLQGGYSDEVMTKLCNVAKSHNVQTILIESNFGDGMFAQLLKPHLGRIYPCQIVEVRQHTMKEARIIETLEPVLNQHRLVIDPSVISKEYEECLAIYPPDQAPKYMLMYQLSRITKERGALKQDDRLDSLAMAVEYFNAEMDLDEQAAKKHREDEAWEAELERWRMETDTTYTKGSNFHNRMCDNINNGFRKR